MKTAGIVVLLFFTFLSAYCQTSYKAIFSVDLNTKQICEVNENDQMIGYSFSFVDIRFPNLSHSESIRFDNFESLKSFFMDVDSVFNNYELKRKESMSIKLHGIDVRLSWYAQMKTLFIFNEDQAYFMLNKYNLSKIEKFVRTYQKAN